MKYKILHLPTATYLIYDGSNTADEEKYLYSEFEIENRYYSINIPRTLFPTKRMAIKYLNRLIYYLKLDKDDPNRIDDLCFDESGKESRILPTFFEIVEVNDNEM